LIFFYLERKRGPSIIIARAKKEKKEKKKPATIVPKVKPSDWIHAASHQNLSQVSSVQMIQQQQQQAQMQQMKFHEQQQMMVQNQ
jgi:hypothetical protein